MAGFSPSDIACRVRALIEQHDNGNEAAAARRLGVSSGALAKLLAGASEHLNLDTLGAVVDTYDVDATWLLVGERHLAAAALSGEDRLRVAELLSALSARVLSRHAPPDTEAARGLASAVRREVLRHRALHAEHRAALVQYEARRARFLRDVADHEARWAQWRADAAEHHQLVTEWAADREARAEVREAVRRYVAELKAEWAPLHRVLVSVLHVVRDAAAAEAALPGREAQALTADVVRWALDAYHAAA
jgi:transcriptional regulator with XRE-family HTH domain